MATTVGIRDLKNSLSRYLRLVRAGEDVIVLDRGRPVAVLSAIEEPARARSSAEHLASLAKQGLLELGTPRDRRVPRTLPEIDLSGAVIADREDRG